MPNFLLGPPFCKLTDKEKVYLLTLIEAFNKTFHGTLADLTPFRTGQ